MTAKDLSGIMMAIRYLADITGDYESPLFIATANRNLDAINYLRPLGQKIASEISNGNRKEEATPENCTFQVPKQ